MRAVFNGGFPAADDSDDRRFARRFNLQAGAPAFRPRPRTALRSADFQAGYIADFQIREPRIVQSALEVWCAADLEIGDAAGLETCATGPGCGCAPDLLAEITVCISLRL